MNDKNNNISKKATSVFIIILLGAIGSGLWDIFLKDVFYSLGELFVNLATYLYSGYIDTLYNGVGKSRDVLVYLPSIVILTVIISMPLIFYVFILKINNKDEIKNKTLNKNTIIPKYIESILNNKKKRRIIIFSVSIIMSIQYTSIFITQASEAKAIRIIERRLEIIRPYVEENNYYKLWSEFRLIDNKNKLELLLSKTNKIANKNEILLPVVRLLGINDPNK